MQQHQASSINPNQPAAIYYHPPQNHYPPPQTSSYHHPVTTYNLNNNNPTYVAAADATSSYYVPSQPLYTSSADATSSADYYQQQDPNYVQNWATLYAASDPNVQNWATLYAASDPNVQNWATLYAASDPNVQNWATLYASADPNVQNWATLYASASLATNTTQQSGAAQVHQPSWKNAANYKILKKRKNPVQHVWCDVCKIECNSKEILDSHKQGKKHKKNLEKLKESLVPAPVGVPKNPTIGPPEKPKKRKAKEPEEDLETKKKKIVAGGTAETAIKTCLICNVVCNSELVFRYHLAGQKHLSMMKKGKPLSWPLSG